MTILLLGGFVALATGLLQHLHLRTHLAAAHAAPAEPAAHDEHEGHEDHGEDALPPLLAGGHSHHDDEGGPDHEHEPCGLCVDLHRPVIGAGWVPLLVCLGLFVAFLSLLAPQLAPQRVGRRVDCRGPPVL
jgi:hypothetical protein